MKALTRLHRTILSGLFATGLTTPVFAEDFLDCPLREMPFSLESPFLDVLLSPPAKALVEKYLPEVAVKAPPIFLDTEAPAFGAIVSTQTVLNMQGASADVLAALNDDLKKLPITDEDRRLRCRRYDQDLTEMDIPEGEKRLLIFDKVNGFDHGPSVTAATAAVSALAEQQGWGVAVTSSGGAFTPEILSQFNAVVWNNNSGDVLTLSQREAFKAYIEQGGAYVGIHGSGGDPSYYWDWYSKTLLGAQFIGHPMEPQFQTASLAVEKTPSSIASNLSPGWSMKDEWYSFAESPRKTGASVVATLDESSYDPGNLFNRDLHMGDDHPIAWTRCVGNGQAFYSGIGHRQQVYNLPETLILLRDGLTWAMGEGASQCQNNTETQ